jgi:hypothetical protein
MAALIGCVLPLWARWLALVAICAALWFCGYVHGARNEGQKHLAYIGQQAVLAAKIERAQAKVILQTETVYRDRIKTIYMKGAEIEKQVPIYVTAADDSQYGVNVGWVRQYNATWAGDTASAAADTDRASAGIPISEIAATNAHNATACLAWREQALGWQAFYAGLQSAAMVAD